MTEPLPCPPAPAPVEAYASRLDGLFASRAQRRAFRDYLVGLLLPRDRNKTLTCLAGAEPVVGAQHREVQRLQWFLSESPWDHEKINTRRVELLMAAPATRPHPGGVLILDDSGDRKSGHATAGVSRQYIGSRGGPYRIGGPLRLVVATTDPATRPTTSTWYLATTLPRPDLPTTATSAFSPASYDEIIRLYGLRGWVEQDYKQVKHELGWADFQVRSATAIARRWTLVNCAFSLCWHDTPTEPPTPSPARNRSAAAHRRPGRSTSDRSAPA